MPGQVGPNAATGPTGIQLVQGPPGPTGPQGPPGSPGSGSNGVNGVAWLTALDFDWTAGSSTTFSTDGAVTYNGYTFQKINSAQESTHGHCTAGAGTGLGFEPNTGGTYTTSTKTVPGLWLPISQIPALANISLATPLRFTIYSPSGIYYSQPDAIVWAVDHNDGNAVTTAAYVAAYEYLFGAPGAGVAVFSGNASSSVNGNDGGVTYSSHTNGFVGCLELPFGIAGAFARTYVSPGASYSGGAWPALSALGANASVSGILGSSGSPLQRYLWSATPGTLVQNFGFLVGALASNSVTAPYIINRMKIEYVTGF